MTSLTKIAIATRKIIRYSIYLIIFGIVLRMVVGFGITVYKRLFPAPPPAPTIAFGKLPKIEFPNKTDLPSFEFIVETTEGNLPILPAQAKVFYMPKLSSSLLALDVAKEKVAGLGFTTEPVKVSETIYKFINPRSPSTLEINIITGAFSISYDLAADSTPLEKRPPTPDLATSQVRSFLSSGNILPADLDGPTSHEFLKTELQKLVPALSLSEANLVRVSLFRKSLDKLPSMTIDPNKGNVWFMVSGNTSREKQIIAGEYHYFPVDETQSSTYPLKTAQVALEELKTGKGYIADLGQNKEGKVTIRRVYLAYLDPNKPSQFYQPIIVFEGDRGFIGYVPAITDQYLNQ